MANRYFVLFGGNKLNKGVIDKIKGLFQEIKIIVFDWNKNPYIVGDIHYEIDVKDYQKILETLIFFHRDDEYIGGYTSIDLAVHSLNELNKYFNKCFIPDLGIMSTSSKKNMVKIWKDNNLLNRTSIHVSEADYTENLFQTFRGYDIIIKPNIGSSSRGISILEGNNSKEEFFAALNFAKFNSVDATLIIEEFVRGQEFTVEMLGDNYGNVGVYGISVKYHTNNTYKNKIAVKLHYNSSIYNNEFYNNLAEIARECYRSLHLKNCFGHLEIILKQDGSFTPIEIGARSSGFIASHLVDIVSEKNYLQEYLMIINGGAIENKFFCSHNSSMYFFYDIPPGISKKTENIMNYLPKSIFSLYNERNNLFSQNNFNLIHNDMERYGYEILSGHKEDLTIDTVDSAEVQFIRSFLR